MSKNEKSSNSGASVSNQSVNAPAIVNDPRFAAGRTLIKKGLAQEGAIEIFSTLVEECIAKYGESSIETAPAFFEYGNALLRASNASAAAAAESEDSKEDAKPKGAGSEKSADEDVEGDAGEDQGESDDLELALEMMENSFSILEEFRESQTAETPEYDTWEAEQRPRILLGLGDCLSALDRHADAADAYSRVLELQQNNLEACKGVENLNLLRAHRRVCEATVLIAEEILACPSGEDITTTETQSLIVKSDERIEYARGYYDKARDSLQETVYTLGKLASKSIDLGTEKEDVCFLATMVMGVGEALAQLDEMPSEPSEHKNKKLKTG